jgi:hypothetical protein
VARQCLPWEAEGGGGGAHRPGGGNACYIQQYLGLCAALLQLTPEDDATGSSAKGFWYIRRVGLGTGLMVLKPLHELQLRDGRLRGGGADGESRRGEGGGGEAKQ